MPTASAIGVFVPAQAQLSSKRSAFSVQTIKELWRCVIVSHLLLWYCNGDMVRGTDTALTMP
jgi:hypothetical protein